MHLYIDPRAGSKPLLNKFPGECEESVLEFGDIAFFGNGPEDSPVWYIGIEYKKLDDVVACIKSGRFTGTQLPGMMRLYDVSFLLIEGIPKSDEDGQLISYRGRNITYRMGLPYQAYDNFLTSIALFSALFGKPCIVKLVASEREAVKVIRDQYLLFQKNWDEHKAISRPDLTKIQRVSYDLSIVPIKPTDEGYPKHILRKAVFQIDKMGWDIAGLIAEKFGTLENALAAGQKEWQSIEHVGPVLADRVYRAFHGYSDPEAVKKKRKLKEI